jgi:hypothetical protein
MFVDMLTLIQGSTYIAVIFSLHNAIAAAPSSPPTLPYESISATLLAAKCTSK